jgi:hypothetical protein
VPQQSEPLAIAIAFTEAWTSHDLTTAAGYVADDVTFDGPMNHLVGARAYLEGLAAFAPAVTSLRMLAAFGDEEQALIMYELSIRTSGTLVAAERLTVKDGKIRTDQLTFDSYPMRQARAAQAVATSQPA